MSKIDNEIDQVAETLEKSTKSPQDQLFDTIRELGPEGIRAKLPTLEKAEKELLVDALEEMKKAVEMDKEYQAKYVQGKITDTILQEDKADDDQDEKLVMKEAAKQNHQGTPVEGWEGQVIKAKEMSEDREEAAEKIMSMEEKEHKTKDPKKLVEAEKKEKKMEKGDDMDKCGEKMMKKQGVPEGVDSEKQERCVRKLKGQPGKNPYAICNASMKKGEVTEEVKDALLEIKKSVEEQLKEQGIEAKPELVKSEMKRLLQEESQNGDAPEMNEKTRANKEKAKELELSDDNKDAQKEVNDMKQGQMKKAIWGSDNDLLKANTNGRNFHFSYSDWLEVQEATKDLEVEEVKKSESEENLNDIIEKSQDASWDQVTCERMLKSNKEKIKGSVFKSFETNEIAEALGLSEEEAKKILGE